MGWAKYYEDNVRISEERYSTSNNSFYNAPITPVVHFKCPFCSERFISYLDLCNHISTVHANSQAFFVINQKIVREESMYIESLNSLSFMNYGSNEVIGSICINGESIINTTYLDSHNRIADLSGLAKEYVIKDLELKVIINGKEELYHVSQKLNILEAKEEDIQNQNYKSAYFYDDVAAGTFKLAEYRVFLSMLVHEGDNDSVTMVVEKIQNDLKTLATSDEELLDFLLYYGLLSGEYREDLVKYYCSEKDYFAFKMLIALLQCRFDEAQSYQQKIGRCLTDFQRGCSLLLAYLQDDEVAEHYYEDVYVGSGILRNILSSVHFIVDHNNDNAPEDLTILIDSLRPFKHDLLITYILMISDAFLSGDYISKDAYEIFGQISPIGCALYIEQIEDETIKHKILKSALKRFSTVEWFIEYASANLDNSWVNTKITKRTPNLYRKYVDEINQKLEIPFGENFLTKLIASKDISITALGNATNVGGSCYVISALGYNIMLDCGLRPGIDDHQAYPDFQIWNKEIDAIIISHAHIDHSGAIARAHAIWPSATIYSTIETKAFLEPLLSDISLDDSSAALDAEAIPIDKAVAIEAYEKIIPVRIDEWIHVSNKVKFRLHLAGHLLGAAMIELVIGDSTILYTGDICMNSQELTPGARLFNLPHNPDLMICEATYLHDDEEPDWMQQRTKIRASIYTALYMGKTVLLPATAIGRSQELLCIIGDMKKDGMLNEHTKVYIGGFSCKTCAAIMDHLNDSYRDVLDITEPLLKDTLPRRGSIIIASSGSMKRNTASYRIAQSIKKRDPSELTIIAGNWLDDDAWAGIKKKRVDTDCPLSVHASKREVLGLIETLHPRSIAMVHWGTDEADIKRKVCNDIRHMFNGDIQTFLLDNTITVINDPKEWIEKELR